LRQYEGIFSKVMCLGHAQKEGFVAFTVPGIDRFFDTSPLNIVEKSLKEGTSGYAGLDWRPSPTAKAMTTPMAEATVSAAPTPTPCLITPTNVVSAITSNRWSGDALIVSGTLTNASTVAVLITGIDGKGFDQDQKMVIRGSDFTVAHNDLAPGEVVNFKVALKDGTKQVKFVKVEPSWSH
jgi:hypothetical protein